MLEYIRGKLVYATPFKATVEVTGLGYGLHIHLNTYNKLPQTGSEVTLHIATVIREDSHKLYGFLSNGERDLFETLNTVSGIGPKTSLSLLGHMEPADLQIALNSGNVAVLSKVPGIGKKTAERLMIELRDKCCKVSEKGDHTTTAAPGVSGDAVQALIHLGYNPLLAQKTVHTLLKETGKDLPLSELITQALRNI